MFSAFMQYNEVFVTGGTGPLGVHVCRALADRKILPPAIGRGGETPRRERVIV